MPPKDPTYQWIYTELKQRGALEKLQTLLSPFRLPKTLDVSLDECGGESEARRLIIGAARAYDIDEKRNGGCRPMEDYAGEHGTPAQRVFNELCIAYGANPKLFSDVVNKGYLPRARAEYCVEEYEQVQEAFEKLIHPHVDLVLAEELSERKWLQEPEQ